MMPAKFLKAKSLNNLPMLHPDRELTGFQPLKALGHFRKLIADKEDTKQVFHIIEATKGRKTVRQAVEFVQSADGKSLLDTGADIPAMLDDHNYWSDCGPQTVAQHYIQFMQREGLTAAGLVAESENWLPQDQRPEDLYEWYLDRLRDTHDLFHVLTGYGRDALGELCLLAFSYAQNHNRGLQFIAYAGALQIRKDSGSKAPMFAAVREGQRLGVAAAKLSHQDIEKLMHEPIADARARLNLGEPEIYRECLKTFAAEGLFVQDPGRAPEAATDCCAA